jgi:PAS domain S-box-containing protein
MSREGKTKEQLYEELTALRRRIAELENLTIQHKSAAQTLSDSEQRYRTLFEDIPIGLYRTTPDGRIMDANPALVEMLRYPDRETMLGIHVLETYVSPEDRQLFRAQLERADVVLHRETQLRCYDGTTIWVNEDARVIRDQNGAVLHYEGSLEDITERKRMETYVLHTERLAAMGRMAAALAHEIRNPLQAIQSHLELVLDFPIAPEEREEYLRFCCQEVSHLAELTARVLHLAHGASDARAASPVADLIHHALKLVHEPLRRAGIQVTTDFPTEPPPVLVVPERIIQVLLNLLLNAIDALPHGGHIDAAAEVADDMVHLTLTNDGPPIPATYLPHLFEPFYTTKPEGTGLGLFISYNIVQQHGGRISVQNLEDDHGVAFTIALPIARPAGQDSQSEGQREQPGGGQ